MKKILLLLICLFNCFLVQAQESTVKKAQQNFDSAQKLMLNRDYDGAAKLLEDAVAADPSFQFAFIQLADVYKFKKSFEQAKNNYLKAIAITNPAPEARVYYSLAETELNTGDYENARKHFVVFKDGYKGKEQLMIQKARKYILDCDFAMIAIKHPEKYEPRNLGPAINTKDREYLPTLTADGSTLIFSRTVDGNEDFYVSHKVNKEWRTAVPLSDKINTRFNEGAQSISPDGMYLFFTGCNREDGFGSCDLYVSHKNGNAWDTPFNLGAVVNSSSWDSQPAISPDGSTLYFVSNRPGGIGGYDIWKTTLNSEGEWSKPENLGPEINTIYDENTPFVHPDGKTLYFSSNGWPGMGNMDIFYSRAQPDGKWGKPVNIGYPINTFNEETGLMVSPDGTEGLFSSALKGGFGDMDIYSFKMPESARPLPITYVKGIVRDKETRNFLEARVQVVNLKTKETKFNDYTSASTGEFLAVMPMGSTYAFNAVADGYLFYSDNFVLNQTKAGQPYTLEIYLEKLKPGANMILRNIFFDTNKYELLPPSITELTNLLQLLQASKTVSIEIQGHTDNEGNAEANQTLSLQRAKAVYDYLIANQINPDRLTFKGFGATKPIASNDTTDGRQQNRRTSFIITSVR
ncbi:OmpA family protein [Pedobacter cryoconitis]|uniref:Outer membrane protein OmpA-like peptidoglycan-associated protein/Tol biopolymer transport system component n=1 Tax=Pedobacter cryoconitis TaxID=188932 RepID=A0A7X0MIP5_9SPHI|nr:OmpA family protein [Pedobacter cryoconitis]MBB6498648.1 outer membrane protein OmpA-like peptidoglycan-associated protein/Tol biopolymer transport system component [Pedobacter cryoconitis]